MTLIEGDWVKRKKILGYAQKFGPKISILAYLAGLIYFIALPHNEIVHRTYISENSLLPGILNQLSNNKIDL